MTGNRVTEPVASIFERRGTHEVPAGLPNPPADWGRPWAPVLTGAVDRMTWNPDSAAWLRRT